MIAPDAGRGSYDRCLPPGPAAPGYAVKLERVAIRGGDALDIYSLRDRQQYADAQGEAEAAGISPASWPLFGLIWPSARKLADLMQGWDVAGRHVLEVGCGLALASLVIHRRRGDVTASDRHPLAASFLSDNLRLNRMADLPYRTGNWAQSNPALERFDLIIGSDVLYERSHPDMLAAFVGAHATAHAEVLIVDPNRGNRTEFNRRMVGLAFGLSETVLDAPLADGLSYRGRLLHYRR